MSPKLGDGGNETVGRKDKGSVGVGVALRGIRRYPLIALTGLLLTGGVAAGVWFFLPLPKMTAYSVFRIESQPSAVIAPVGDAKTDFRVYAQSQAGLLKSRRIVNAAMTPDLTRLPFLQGHDDQLTWLVDRLQVDFKQGPELMRLSLEGDDPEQIQAIVAAISRVYLERVEEQDKGRKQRHLDSLDEVRKKYEDSLRKRRESIRRHAELLGSSDPKSLAEKERTLQEQVREIQKELFRIRSEIWQTQIELRGHEARAKADAPIPDEVIVQAVRMRPAYKALEDKRLSLEEELAYYKKNVVDPKHYLRVKKEADLAQIQKDLKDEEARSRPEVAARIKENAVREGKHQAADLQEKLRMLGELETQFRNDLDDVSRRIRDMNLSQVDLEELKRDIEVYEQMADRVAKEVEAIRPELQTPSRVQVYEEATVVPGIEGKRRLKYTLMAAGGVLALGLGLTTFLEIRNRRILDTSDVSRELGLRILGTVPSLPQGLGQSTSASEWQYVLTESVDATRTILLNGLDSPKSSRTFLIGSAMPGEGKTSLSGHLAISLARVGYRTLLIDGDMRRPGIHRLMGLTSTPGLSEVLRGEGPVQDAIRVTAIDRLSVLPAGKWDRAASAALVGDVWPQLREQLEAEFEFVIVDSAPLLAVTDSLLMARHTDGVVLSTLWNVSEFAALSEAKERLAVVGGKVLGVVVSGVRGRAYLSRYGRYGLEAQPEPSDAG